MVLPLPLRLDDNPVVARYEILKALLDSAPSVDTAIEAADRIWRFIHDVPEPAGSIPVRIAVYAPAVPETEAALGVPTETMAPAPVMDDLVFDMQTVAERLLVVLEKWASPTGEIARSALDTIAMGLGYDDYSGIRKALYELRDAGRIEVEGGKGRGNPITRVRLARPHRHVDAVCTICGQRFSAHGSHQRECMSCRRAT